jgi:NAD(P)-dependent dehydrogenase (short-subunit alcohol dehydrogenase family)
MGEATASGGPPVAAPGALTGGVAVVTGGGSGIGRAVALAYAAAGARVAVADLDEDAARSTCDLVAAAGGEAHPAAVDVADAGAVAAWTDDVLARWGRLDVACNNAGTSGTYAPLADQPLEDWERVLAVNLTGTFLCLRAQVPAMVAGGGGAVVNVASAAGLMGFAHLPAYVASKHGVVGLTKSVALEVAHRGVRVNAVCPGSIRTPMLAGFAGGDEAALEAMGRQAPMRRLGTPEEVAEAVVWLCDPVSSFVTGQALGVDGGVLAT